jgi:hypothetical protein
MYCRLFIIMSIFLSGCTSQLWETPSYSEKVTGFYGVEGKELLIVSGQKYSYLFEADQNFKDVLSASRTTEYIPKYRKFRLDKDNNVSGELSLMVFKPSNKDALSQMGFEETEYGNMEISFTLTGKRYIVEGSFPFEKLEDEHFILVETPESGIGKTGKIVATPVTVAIDAVAIIPVAAMFAILGAINQRDLEESKKNPL